jgi:hypothetical protein
LAKIKPYFKEAKVEKISNINFQNKSILFSISFAKSLNLSDLASACAAVKTQAKAAF